MRFIEFWKVINEIIHSLFWFGLTMDWLVFALLSPAFWGLSNVFNKFLVAKKFSGYFSIASYLHFVDLIFACIIYFVAPVSFQFPYVFWLWQLDCSRLRHSGFTPKLSGWRRCRGWLLCSSLYQYLLSSCPPYFWMKFWVHKSIWGLRWLWLLRCWFRTDGLKVETVCLLH